MRARVADAALRPAFDAWYRDEHLPDAVRAFGAASAWRGWSREDPAVHCANYGFDSAAALDAAMSSPGIAGLIAEFDRVWRGRVTRTRETTVVAEAIGVD